MSLAKFTLMWSFIRESRMCTTKWSPTSNLKIKKRSPAYSGRYGPGLPAENCWTLAAERASLLT